MILPTKRIKVKSCNKNSEESCLYVSVYWNALKFYSLNNERSSAWLAYFVV